MSDVHSFVVQWVAQSILVLFTRGPAIYSLDSTIQQPFNILLFLDHRSLIKNKTQTAVINILNLFILIMTFVCAPHTFSKVTVDQLFIYKTKRMRGLESRLSKYLTVRYIIITIIIIIIIIITEKINKASAFHFRRWRWKLAQILEWIRSLLFYNDSLFCPSLKYQNDPTWCYVQWPSQGPY